MSDNKLPNDYLEYPYRSYGMDHDLYSWSMMTDRPRVTWPDDKKLALWVNVPIQFFPLNQQGKPFKVPAGMTMPYPDLRHFSLRDYGNRIGIYRLLKAFDRYKIEPTFAINSEAAIRMPSLINTINDRGNDVICYGVNMDTLLHNGLSEDQERDLIQQALSDLSERIDQPIKGWLSPAKNESSNTLKLLSELGIEFVCDWVNDELPYQMQTENGEITAMPLATEVEDYFVIQQNLHSEESWMQQICDACDFLIDEANQQGGRMLSLTIHPWLMGQPHRIGYLEKALNYLSSKTEIWHAGANQISEHWNNNQPRN